MNMRTAQALALIGWLTPDPGQELVVFHWSKEYGECEDCGLPVAYLSVNAYGIGKHQRLCSICAAEAASNGQTITRVDKS